MAAPPSRTPHARLNVACVMDYHSNDVCNGLAAIARRHADNPPSIYLLEEFGVELAEIAPRLDDLRSFARQHKASVVLAPTCSTHMEHLTWGQAKALLRKHGVAEFENSLPDGESP